jgi:ABC-2 type transport system permease protein
MAAMLSQSAYLTWRNLRNQARQPWYVAVTLIQPLIWLLFFGGLFRRIAELPGFGAGSDDYVGYLIPGMVVMTALMSSSWNGLAMLGDIDRGVLGRLFVSPASKAALLIGPLAYQVVLVVLQGGIMVALGLALGGRLANGLAGLAVLFGCAVLLGTAIGGLSNALALYLRREESLIAAVNVVVLPATFLSSSFVPGTLSDGWIVRAARFNPVEWAVTAARSAMSAQPDWGRTAVNVVYLTVFMVGCLLLAVRAFRTYQRRI